MHTRVSIIIPTHNGAHLLPECLDALWHQTYRDFELIVVDDASTDNTAELLLAYPEVKHLLHLPGERGNGFDCAPCNGRSGARIARTTTTAGALAVVSASAPSPSPVWAVNCC